MARYGSYGGWDPYVPVGVRKAQALKKVEAMRKKGKVMEGIEAFRGSKLAKTFWGANWCEHLETFHDYSNRLPRGKRYLRKGSVVHLGISKGKVEAYVSGSSLYKIEINITTLPEDKWKNIKQKCTGQISSLVELLQGRFSNEVMEVVTNPKNGLFPLKKEISFDCDCPDWAGICKHIAAVFYGIGKRLDSNPELLFILRGVNSEELVDADVLATATSGAVGSGTSRRGSRRRLAKSSLGDVFGVEIESGAKKRKTKPASTKTTSAKAVRTLTGNSITDCRKKMKLSAASFAKKVGVPVSSIYNWERKADKQLSIRDKKQERKLKNIIKNELKSL